MDITSCVSWAHDLLSWLWQKGWRGKAAAVVVTIALLVVSCVWGWSELSASANAKAEITAAPKTEIAAAAPKVTGAAGCCSPEGWPTVGKTTVRLSGVGPISTNARDRFGHWITSHGSYLECDSSDDGISYRCLTPQRLDVAQALLLNGATHVTHAAPPLYRAAEEQASKMGRGP
jgi:hypothetical protein